MNCDADGGANEGGSALYAVPTRIDQVRRIIPDIGVEVDSALRADGVGLQEAAECGGIGAGAIVVEAPLGVTGAAPAKRYETISGPYPRPVNT